MKAIIRKDLYDSNVSIPIGDGYYHDLTPLEYRWKREDTEKEQFQVLHNSRWKNAYSIDFDFIEEEKK